MRIVCWGSRGSLPVSGPLFIRYGGNTTCMEIRADSGDVVVIDAGSGIRGLGEKLQREKRKHFTMLFTHAHWDHILGFPFFTPLYQKGTSITIKGCSFGSSSFRTILKGQMTAPYFPVGMDAAKARLSFSAITGKPFSIGSLSVNTIPLSHPNGGVGFRFEEKGKSFVFLTDNELGTAHPGSCSFDDYVAFCRGADLLIHDAEFTRKDYPLFRSYGHSVVTDTVKLALRAGVQQLGLFHLNRMRTDNDVDAMVGDARKKIQRSKADTSCFAVGYSFQTQL